MSKTYNSSLLLSTTVARDNLFDNLSSGDEGNQTYTYTIKDL